MCDVSHVTRGLFRASIPHSFLIPCSTKKPNVVFVVFFVTHSARNRGVVVKSSSVHNSLGLICSILCQLSRWPTARSTNVWLYGTRGSGVTKVMFCQYRLPSFF